MNALHCQPACFTVAQVARPVSEVLHAAESSGHNSCERLLRLVLLNAAVDNLQVFQLKLKFDLGQEAGFLTVAVQTSDLRFGKQDRQGNARHPATTANIQPTAVFDKRHHTQAVEQMARNHFVRVTHSREVVSLIPFDQQGQIRQQLLMLVFSQRDAQLACTCG